MKAAWKATRALLAGTCCAGAMLSTLAVPAVGAAAPKALPFDFNGDGNADLAVGVPGEQVGKVAGAGAVQVIYGSTRGLTPAGNQLWTQESAGIKGHAARAESFGAANASGDFDGDGYADLAVGAPGLGNPTDGSVAILYGSRSGLSARDQLFRSADIGQADPWGTAVGAGDFDGDGDDDLALSVQPLTAGATSVVTVLQGSPTGITTAGFLRVTDDSPALPKGRADDIFFGRSTATGDVTGDGRDELVVSARDSNNNSQGFYVFRGSPQGITGVDVAFFGPGTAGLTPAGTTFADLGARVTLGDFDGDGHDDLAAGDIAAGPAGFPGCERPGGCPGVVLVLRGTPQGLTTADKQLWSQDSPNVPGTAETGDAFGWSVGAGDLNGDGRADLAVGIVGESLRARSVSAAGAVNVLYGSSRGLTGAGAQLWSQDSSGVRGTAENDDYLGRQLRVQNFGRGSAADLAATPDGESVGRALYAGAVNVWYGSSRGLSADGNQLWSQDSRGITGTAQLGDLFGTMNG